MVGNLEFDERGCLNLLANCTIVRVTPTIFEKDVAQKYSSAMYFNTKISCPAGIIRNTAIKHIL